MRQQRAQPGRLGRLSHQFDASATGCSGKLFRGIGGDDQRRHIAPQMQARFRDRCGSEVALIQMLVGNHDVGNPPIGERPERFLGGGCQPHFATPASEQNPHGFKDRGIVLDEQDFGAEQAVSTRTFRLDRRGGGLAVCDCRERHLHMEDRAAADL